MSELTQCNYCTWEDIKKHAKERLKTYELRASNDIPGWQEAVIDGEVVAYFKKVTDYCVC